MSATTQTDQATETTTSTEPAPALDFATVEVFAGRVLDVVSNAATALTLSIGHRTGLFDSMAGCRRRRRRRSPRPLPYRSDTSANGSPR